MVHTATWPHRGTGLDARAFRLECPPGTAVYEVDAPLVIAFKDDVLGEQDASDSHDPAQGRGGGG
jgi:O-methyltransferase involved in polyketide biosynthesis